MPSRETLRAILVATSIFLGALALFVTQWIADLDGETPSTTTEQAATSTVPETTTSTEPHHETTTSTVAEPTTTTIGGEPFADVAFSDWVVSGRNYGVGDSSSEPSGSFRTFCEFSHLAHDDPIVYPGQPDASHLHMFFGNTAIDSDTSAASIVREGNGTCDGGPLNRTGYWMPAVFDAQGRVVVADSFEIYYKALGSSGSTLAQRQESLRRIQPFPDGLRMIAGYPGGHWSWKCGNGPEWRSIPPCTGGQRLTVSVRFPYCWTGRPEDLDSPDHRSHMAYGVNNGWGSCPSSHPVHLPELTEFAHFEGVTSTEGWTIASDMGATGGSTFHADWWNGWHPLAHERWLENCLHGLRSTSNGTFCDGLPVAETRLRPAPNYSGPRRIEGYTPMSE